MNFFRARIFLIMELMEGGELFEKIRNHVRFTEKEAREVAKQVTFFVMFHKGDSPLH